MTAPKPKHRRPRRYHGPAPFNAGLGELFGKTEAAGRYLWRRRHGDKTAFTFCQALRTARTTGFGAESRLDGRPIVVYPCRATARICEPHEEDGPLHWHIGHLRAEAQHATAAFVTLADTRRAC